MSTPRIERGTHNGSEGISEVVASMQDMGHMRGKKVKGARVTKVREPILKIKNVMREKSKRITVPRYQSV